MKKVIIFFLTILFPAIAGSQQLTYYIQAQQNQIDSLQKVLKNSTNDTLRMEIFRDLGYYYQEIKRDSGIYCHEQELMLAQKLKLKLWEADAYDNAGYMLNALGNYPRSLQYLLKGLKIAEDPESEKGIWKISKFTSEGIPRIARLSVLGNIYCDLGLLYDESNNLDQAVIVCPKAMKIGEEINDKTILSWAHMNMGFAYLKMNKLDSAILLEEEAIDYGKQSGNTKYAGICLSTIGTAYLKKGDKALAKKYFNESIQSNLKENNFKYLADANLAMANLLKSDGDLDSSLSYVRRCLELNQSTHSPAGIADAYTALSVIYKMQNKTDSAFIFLNLALAAKDSLNNADKIRQFQNVGFDEQLREQELEKEKIESQNKIRIYEMLGGLSIVLLIAFFLYRNNRQKQKANRVLEKTLNDLKTTQSQLIQSEKMASLGELTAGIAHEIQNPLNFVNNFSEINTELIEEMKTDLTTGKNEEAMVLANDISDNEQKINHHGKRADAIVKGMLQHSRSSNGQKEPSDINKLADEYLRLAYHGLRAKNKSFNATMKTDYDESIGKINIIPQDIGRAILNLITNAFYAVDEKKEQQPEGYEPTVSVSTKKIDGMVMISVVDNGKGIPNKLLDKIFQPFFTTKPTGQGTGLGLSLSYDIIKAHGGELDVKTKEGEGSEFTIKLPKN